MLVHFVAVAASPPIFTPSPCFDRDSQTLFFLPFSQKDVMEEVRESGAKMSLIHVVRVGDAASASKSCIFHHALHLRVSETMLSAESGV